MDTQNNARDQLQKWLEFTQRIRSSLILEEALETILDVSLDLTGMDYGCVLLYDPVGELRFRTGRNRSGETLEEKDFPGTQDAVKGSLERQQTFYFTSDSGTVRCGFCAPLFSHQANSILGFLYEDSTEVIHFGDQEKETIDVLALHAGPALEAAIFYEMATRDTNTGVFLLRYFDAMAFVEWKRSLRHRHPISVMIVDIDQLKDIKVIYGKQEADSVLKKTAATLKYACRTEDIIARHGGDEFVVLLPETGVAGVKKVAQRIRDNMPRFAMEGAEVLTVSIGAAGYPRCAVNDIQDLVRLADIALSHAKQAGPGHIVVYDPSLIHDHTKLF